MRNIESLMFATGMRRNFSTHAASTLRLRFRTLKPTAMGKILLSRRSRAPISLAKIPGATILGGILGVRENPSALAGGGNCALRARRRAGPGRHGHGLRARAAGGLPLLPLHAALPRLPAAVGGPLGAVPAA